MRKFSVQSLEQFSPWLLNTISAHRFETFHFLMIFWWIWAAAGSLLPVGRHFSKIESDGLYPLHPCIIFNSSRRSSRNYTVYKPERAQTQKRAQSPFQVFMSRLNFLYIFLYVSWYKKMRVSSSWWKYVFVLDQYKEKF